MNPVYAVINAFIIGGLLMPSLVQYAASMPDYNNPEYLTFIENINNVLEAF